MSHGVIVKDELMKDIHTGQMLKELKLRIPASHFRWNTEDAKFTAFHIKIPTKVWHEVTKK